VVQEALTNVARHAGASRAWVTVRRDTEGLDVEVMDDGRGPDTDLREGGGLTGMRERAAALGGTVQAGSGPRGGFRVVVRFPLDNSPARPEGQS
jgi:signal transduction histidine kinase